MLQIKHQGLSVSIDTQTGQLTLRYVYPIKEVYMPEFQSVAEAYNISVESYLGKKSKRTQCTYVITANSEEAFTKFRAVQKQLKILSRELKIETLKQQVLSLQS